MARLIDADALKDELELADFETDSRMFGGQTVLFEDSVFKIVDSAPTISPDEVRGVVRCGECKFWRRPPSCEGMARCETGETGIRYRSKNDFCSRGAKMKGAEENHTMDEFMYGQEMGSHSDGSL